MKKFVLLSLLLIVKAFAGPNTLPSSPISYQYIECQGNKPSPFTMRLPLLVYSQIHGRLIDWYGIGEAHSEGKIICPIHAQHIVNRDMNIDCKVIWKMMSPYSDVKDEVSLRLERRQNKIKMYSSLSMDRWSLSIQADCSVKRYIPTYSFEYGK